MALAEDAAQEAFIKAYHSLDRFKGDSSFSTWLYRIAANHCKDLLRKRARQKTEPLEAVVQEMGERLEEGRENADLIERMLAAIPEDYRAVLILRETEGMSYQEIAQTLNISVDAVKARLKRARAEIARHFSASKNV